MSDDAGVGRSFPTTHWSQIARAADETSTGPRPALAELLQRYLPALRAHVIHRRQLRPDQVDDLLQSFISSKVLEADLMAHADRARGKFRTFLLTALDRFVISQQRQARALKRGADRVESLDLACDVAEPPRDSHPCADSFDIAWARQILRQTLDRMKEQCDADQRPDIWGVFQSRVLKPALEGASPEQYESLVRRFGYRSPTQLWNAVRTAKLMFARLLRQVIAEYTDADDQIEAELLDLRSICARAAQDAAPGAYP
jgi:RNA polymerase sigma-70 factor (ECF subfamily)